MQKPYSDYLESLHAKMTTPDDIIQKVINDTTGKTFINLQRIIAGEANEVYDVTLTDTSHIILRISREGFPYFQHERWAITKAKTAGVPIPGVIAILTLKHNDGDLAFCLMEKIDGEPLERGSIDFMSLSEDERRNYINQAGEILSKIHSIKTKGFGNITGEGSTEYPTADAMLDDILTKGDFYQKIAKDEKIDPQFFNRAIQIIASFKEPYLKISPTLVHGDYAHKHFMVKNKKIVAILDWGQARSDNPISDLAYWDYWFGHYIPTKWLIEGYQNKNLFDKNFQDMLHFNRLIKGLIVLGWYSMQKYQTGVDLAIPKLQSDIKYFK